MSKSFSPPSAHDVARVAGVSQSAVSRAFTPGASVAEATKQKIFRAAKSIGYRPNLIARSLIKGRSDLVGVVIGHLNPRNPIFVLSLNALSERLAKAGKHILIFTADDVAADAHVESLLKYRVEALVLMATSLSPKLADQCRIEGIPVIYFNRPQRKTKRSAVVTGNNREGGAQVAKHLLERGYRKLAVMAGLEESTTGREREAGFTDYLASEGLAIPARAVGHFQREGAINAARELLSRKSKLDAVFCVNDYMALAMIEIARYEFGLEIGRQIGVAGFDDIEQASWPSFDLTTYSLPMQPMIDQVTEILLTPPEGEWSVHTVIDGALKVRNSTRRD